MSLSDLSIRAFATPDKGQVTHFDTQIRGFGVRISQGGTKTFILMHGEPRKRVTLGRYPIISLAQARDLARKRLAEQTLGIKPPAMGLQALIARFLADKRLTARPSTMASYTKRLTRHLNFDDPIDTITARRLTEVFDRLRHTPQERSHLIAVTKIMFRYAYRLSLIDSDPAERFSVQVSTPKERTLTPEELKAIWHACGDDTFSTIVKLLILTGQRRGEIQHITLEGDLATIPSAFTKNKRTHVFPVAATAQKLLQQNRTFNGWSKAKARLDKNSGISNYTLHDFRRSAATMLAELSTPPHIIEAILNHKSGIISGVAQTYNRFRYVEEIRQAMKAYEAHIQTIVA